MKKKTTSTSKFEQPYGGRIEFPGPPCVASRPRFTRRGFTYYAKSYKDWLAAATKVARELPWKLPPGYVRVAIEVHVQRPKKPTRHYPRGDVDNYAKGPLDALVKGGVIADDDLVIDLQVTKRYALDPKVSVFVGLLCEGEEE